MNSGYFLLIAIALYGIFKIPAILRIYKNRKDGALSDSLGCGNRIQESKANHIKGSGNSKSQKTKDGDEKEKALGNKFRKLAKADRVKAERIGSTSYIWHGDDCCDECNKNDGKRFKWSSPPATGHPGEGIKCKNGYCRCWAETIIPRR
ncbi:hypothetical protein [Rahnella sp. PD4]|uniref:hypothetical protein n=1 Tax=Rahnella sp. PD4 TaxID=3368611 RepID=UPI003BA0AF91